MVKLGNGTFLAWGISKWGGDISAVKTSLDSHGVEQVWTNECAFLVKLQNGTFLAWGSRNLGGDISAVKASLDVYFGISASTFRFKKRKTT